MKRLGVLGTALTLPLLWLAPPAHADDTPPPTPPSISFSSPIYFSSPTEGKVTVSYVCYSDGGDKAIVNASLRQYLDGPEAQPTAVGLTDDEEVACVDYPVTLDLPFHPEEGANTDFVTGEGTLDVGISYKDNTDAPGASWESSVDVLRTDVTPPAPEKASVKLSADATPERVYKGRTITVKGHILRNGKGYKTTKSTSLQFAADGHGYHRVKTVKSTSTGYLKTTVTATRSGKFRFAFAGNKTTKSGHSAGDHIVVLPKPKVYANCTALNKVYAHGVGKPGAADKGGSVTTFTRDTKTYGLNKKSDRDKDGIACEKK